MAAIPADHDDLWRLYSNIRKRKPEQVIEFGSGCSTLIIAEALRRNSRGKLLSIETDAYWASRTRQELPQILCPLVTVLLTGIEQVKHGDLVLWRHANVPYIEVDFIYLDGPNWRQFPHVDHKGITVDPMFMEMNFRPGFSMLVDYRRVNVAWLRDNLKLRYRFKTSKMLEYSQFSLEPS